MASAFKWLSTCCCGPWKSKSLLNSDWKVSCKLITSCEYFSLFTAPSDLSDNESVLPPPAKRKRSESAGSAVVKTETHPSSFSSAHMHSPKPAASYTGNTMPSTSKITTGYVTSAVGASSGQGSPVKITFTKGNGTPGHQTMPLTSSQKVNWLFAVIHLEN